MAAASSLVPSLVAATDLRDSQFDSVVIVRDTADGMTGHLQLIQASIHSYLQVDKAASTSEVVVISCPELPSRRVIYAPTGPVTRDYDDVRRYYDAAQKGIERAIKAGSRCPLLICPSHPRYELAARVTLLGALHSLYTPVEIRESRPAKAHKVDKLGVMGLAKVSDELKLALAIESGRIVCRDIGGSDPERMAAPRVAEYVEATFKNTCIKMNIISDPNVFQTEYPLLYAVNRAVINIPRYGARVINLEYVGEGTIDTTLMLVGKGITYDTGGADIKYGGHMAGMHRDKCGAAAIAGFFQMLSIYKPKGLKVIGALAVVRNGIGSECYVSDEIITSRAGVRVRIGNTDAEGRMVMADVLCHMKEKAAHEKNPFLFTIATLTGHVIRAFGPNYTGIMENGPAKKAGVARKMQDVGELSADPFEISHLRREDYEYHLGKSEYEDVIQCGNEPSVATNRGHQCPGAFLVWASGLDKHGCDSDKPVPYCHVDIAGSSGPFPGVPTGAPIVAFAHAYVLNRDSAAQ